MTYTAHAMNDFFFRHLPHWHPPNATFFVTFRLAGSLPRSVLQRLDAEWTEEKNRLEAQFQGDELERQRYALSKKYFARFDDHLHRARGPRWLAEPRIADIVQAEIHALHPQHYHLLAFCIMPNHVHLLIDMQGIPDPPPQRPRQTFTALSHAMYLLKGRTAHACRKALGGSGPFWQHESYDHVVRNETELRQIVWYILENPVKAGLVKNWRDWAYTYLEENLL
ncbi:MAG: transposase [Anaerolineae bacterium]